MLRPSVVFREGDLVPVVEWSVAPSGWLGAVVIFALSASAATSSEGGADRSAAARVTLPVIRSFEYVGDNRVVLDKRDDWRDPSSARERQVTTGGSDAGLALLASYQWGRPVRVRVMVQMAAAPPPGVVVTLTGQSAEGLLSMPPSKPIGSTEGGALIEFAPTAQENLPARITNVAGQVRWELKVGRHRIILGRSQHVVLVTAGPPRRAESWPVAGVGAEPELRDHNAFTAFRLEHAVLIASGARSATEAAEHIWRYAMHHYDLSADSDLNPWELLDEDGAGQCMTVASFIEAAVKMLGFPGGRVVYVYPSLTRPKNPTLVATPHPVIPGAFTVEGSDYDLRGQFRTVGTGGATSGSLARHSPEQAAAHQGAHGVERLKMRDGYGELHNYATAFVVDEGGIRSYFGGGYSRGPYHTAEDFLAAACTAVVWAYEVGDSDEWKTICDLPGPGYWWGNGERFHPPEKSVK